MLVSEMITDVRNEIQETTGAFWSDVELIALMNRALRHYSGEVRLEESSAFLTTVNGEPKYNLPSGVLQIKLVMFNAKELSTDQDAWRTLTPSTLEEIARLRPNFLVTTADTRRVPNLFAVYDRQIRFDSAPKFSTPGNLFIFFKTTLPKITETTQDIPLEETLLESINHFMLWKAWKKEQERTLAAESKADYQLSIRRGRRWVKKQAQHWRNRLDINSPVPFTGSNPSFDPLS